MELHGSGYGHLLFIGKQSGEIGAIIPNLHAARVPLADRVCFIFLMS